MYVETKSLSENGSINHKEFLIDTEADLASLPKKIQPGSLARVAKQKKVYILTVSGEWEIYIDYTQSVDPYVLSVEDDNNGNVRII